MAVVKLSNNDTLMGTADPEAGVDFSVEGLIAGGVAVDEIVPTYSVLDQSTGKIATLSPTITIINSSAFSIGFSNGFKN